MNRILLADPNPTLRSALALLLETRLDAQIVGQVSSMESLLCEAAATQPDIIIIGLGLPGEPSQERIATLRQKAPRASVLIACACPEKSNLFEGTETFLCHTDLPETILATIQVLIKRTKQKEVCHV
jgi:DNA-binding NarL/FixJ family response regulator